MELLFYIILAVVAAGSLVAVVAALLRINKEQLQKETTQTVVVAQTDDVAHVQEEVVEEVVVEPVVDTVAPVEDAAATDMIVVDGDSVVFSATKETLAQKYDALSDEMKGYYDEIVNAAKAVEGNRCFKNDRYEEYKVGKNSIVRLLIKRGIIVCEFVIANSDLRNYMVDNKLKVKQAPTTLKVMDQATLEAAKQTMAIAVKQLEEERQYKKEQARAKRKAAKNSIAE